MKHKLSLILVLLAVATLTLRAYYSRGGAGEPVVVTEAVSRGAIVSVVSATGTLEAVTTVLVGTQVSGAVEALNADFNSVVRKGQVLARLEPSLYEAAIEQARASFVRAEADADRMRVAAEDASVKHARARELSERLLIPATELEAARVTELAALAQVRSADAQVTQARATLRQAEVNLAKTVIASPIDGIVIARSVDVGQTVAASLQAPTLFEIAADLTRMQLKASIDEADLGRIAAGQPVRFTVDAYQGETFSGTLEQVRLSPVVSQNVVTYAAIISAPNPELKLKPGMTASVTIETARRDDVLRIPNAAARFRPAADVLAAFDAPAPGSPVAAGTVRLWQAIDGHLRPIAAAIGISDERFTEVVGRELEEGDQFVTRVTLPGSATSAASPATSPLIPSGPPRR